MIPEDWRGKALVSLVIIAGAVLAWVCEVWHNRPDKD